jgi:hypothetical protein
MIVRSGEWVFDLLRTVCVNTGNFCRVGVEINSAGFAGIFLHVPKKMYRDVGGKDKADALLRSMLKSVPGDFKKCYNEYKALDKTHGIKQDKEIIFTDGDNYRHEGEVAGDMLMRVDFVWIYDFKKKQCFNTANDLHYKIETDNTNDCKAALLYQPVEQFGTSVKDGRSGGDVVALWTAEMYLFFYKKCYEVKGKT